MSTGLILSDGEIEALTGYTRAAEQLRELHRQGFTRARRDRLGRVIVERAHYDAVCIGQKADDRPKLRPRLKATA